MTQQQKWKDILREIRLLFGTVEAQVFDNQLYSELHYNNWSKLNVFELKGFHNSYAWRLYWDHQLYKAVECQYLLHLDELHSTVSDIHIELDFKYVI